MAKQTVLHTENQILLGPVLELVYEIPSLQRPVWPTIIITGPMHCSSALKQQSNDFGTFENRNQSHTRITSLILQP